MGRYTIREPGSQTLHENDVICCPNCSKAYVVESDLGCGDERVHCLNCEKIFRIEREKEVTYVYYAARNPYNPAIRISDAGLEKLLIEKIKDAPDQDVFQMFTEIILGLDIGDITWDFEALEWRIQSSIDPDINTVEWVGLTKSDLKRFDAREEK